MPSERFALTTIAVDEICYLGFNNLDISGFVQDIGGIESLRKISELTKALFEQEYLGFFKLLLQFFELPFLL